MDFRDIFSLIFILAGVVMLIIAQVRKRKGMWSSFDSHKEWQLKDLHYPRWSRRGMNSPYELSDFGVILICGGIVSAIVFNFGFKAGGIALSVISAGLLVFNTAVRLRRVDRDDKDAYAAVVSSNIVTGCALALGLFIVAMA